MRLGNTAPFEEMSPRWRAIGNTVFDLAGSRFKPQTSRSKYQRVSACLTLGKLVVSIIGINDPN